MSRINYNEEKHNKNPLYRFPFSYSGFSAYSIHWNLPPYLLDIYLKLLSQIVNFFCFKLRSHWSLPLSLVSLKIGFKIQFSVVRPPFLLMVLSYTVKEKMSI